MVISCPPSRATPTTSRSVRRLWRRVLLVAIVLLVGGIAVATGRHVAPRPLAVLQHPNPIGAIGRGLRYTRYEGGEKIATISADEASLERLRVGVFRLGFAQRLALKNAHLDLGARGLIAASRSDVAHELGMLVAENGTSQATIAAVSVTGVTVRAAGPDGGWIELRAGACEIGPSTAERLRCQGDVHVRDATSDLRFARLDYDLRKRLFVRGIPSPRAHTGSGGDVGARMDADGVRKANALLDRFGKEAL